MSAALPYAGPIRTGALLALLTDMTMDNGRAMPEPSQQQFLEQQRLLEHLTTAVVLLDGELRLRWMNPAAESLLATSRVRVVVR